VTVTFFGYLEAAVSKNPRLGSNRRKIDDGTVGAQLDATFQAPTAVHMEP
jgi:hypothetical protein